MAISFIMFGKYSSESLKKMSPERTKEAIDIINKYGGDVKSMYALLGHIDLVFIVNFSSTETALKASVALNRYTGISFTTSPAITVEEFDRLTEEI
jgi:uncharacterized protein with GYD domain